MAYIESMVKRKTLLLVVNVDWFFISHRLRIAQEALKSGWHVIVAAKDTGKSQQIKDEGIQFINISLSRSGTNPISEFQNIVQLITIYKRVQPTIVHHITLKPIIYGSIAAKFLAIENVVNSISGLGYNFTNNKKGVIPWLIKNFLKIGFTHKKSTVIFQNKDDYRELLAAGILKPHHKIEFIKGSGVNLKEFKYQPATKKEKVVILFVARMLWNKGIYELKLVTDILKPHYKNTISFILCGGIDEDSKGSVSKKYLKQWEDKSYVTWLGHQKNMVPLYQQCDIVVFPSYREGMPKTLLEACASGRPIITTNAFGCKDCVEEGKNGYIVPIKAVEALKNAIIRLVDLPEVRNEMGMYARKKAVIEFDQEEVVTKHLKIYELLLLSAIKT